MKETLWAIAIMSLIIAKVQSNINESPLIFGLIGGAALIIIILIDLKEKK